MQKKRVLLAACFVALNLAFIWGNSVLPGQESSKISSGLLSELQELLPVFQWMPEFLLRKLGHFSEFALLGCLLTWLFRLLGKKEAVYPLLCGILTAMTDETIQLFTLGRSGEVRDVWIDTCGTGTGILFCLCVLAIMKRWKGKQQ